MRTLTRASADVRRLQISSCHPPTSAPTLAICQAQCSRSAARRGWSTQVLLLAVSSSTTLRWLRKRAVCRRGMHLTPCCLRLARRRTRICVMSSGFINSSRADHQMANASASPSRATLDTSRFIPRWTILSMPSYGTGHSQRTTRSYELAPSHRVRLPRAIRRRCSQICSGPRFST